MDRARTAELAAEVARACDGGAAAVAEMEPLLAAYYGYAAGADLPCHDVRGAIGALNGRDAFVHVREKAHSVGDGRVSWTSEVDGVRLPEACMAVLEDSDLLWSAERAADGASEAGWERAGELAALVGEALAARERAMALLAELV